MMHDCKHNAHGNSSASTRNLLNTSSLEEPVKIVCIIEIACLCDIERSTNAVRTVSHFRAEGTIACRFFLSEI